MRLLLLVLAFLFAAGSGLAAPATPFDRSVDDVARHWAHAHFEIADRSVRAAEAARVAAEAGGLSRAFPGRVEPLVWQAIALVTQSEARGGVAGLTLAQMARDTLQRAEAMGADAGAQAAIYWALGALYARTPGFPVGFGDATKARAYLLKSLAIDPDGLESNLFYGDYLARRGDFAAAVPVLQRAISSPAHLRQDVADRGRRAEAVALLAKVRARLRG